jgi:DNA-binding transcriptional ArsR family regulator
VSFLHDRGECTVGEIGEATWATMANVSQHLSRLAAGGVVGRRRECKTVRYRIADDTIEAPCTLVCSGVKERARPLSPRRKVL